MTQVTPDHLCIVYRSTQDMDSRERRNYSDRVELSQLNAYVAVSRWGTIAAAANALHVTPSPLSRTIKELERRLGQDLFERSYHQFHLTDFGAQFLPKAVEILAQADEAERFARGEAAPFRMGGTPWTSSMLTRRLTEAANTYATVVDQFQSDLSSVLLRAMQHGDLDLALVHLPVEEPGISTSALIRYRYAVAAVGEPGLPTDRPLRLGDLRGRSVLSFPLIMQPAPMQAFRDTLLNAGVESIHEIDLRELIGLQARMGRTDELMLVTPGKDLPSGRFLDLDQMQLYPLADDELEMEVGLAWRSRDSVHGDTIRSIVENLHPSGDDLPFLD
ncbi:DNA-binding transcriptional LysR family regulator [Paenarthrobacter sp. TE4293]